MTGGWGLWQTQGSHPKPCSKGQPLLTWAGNARQNAGTRSEGDVAREKQETQGFGVMD